MADETPDPARLRVVPTGAAGRVNPSPDATFEDLLGPNLVGVRMVARAADDAGDEEALRQAQGTGS